MTNTGIHLTQLITKSVEASIHALKLHHDVLKSHTRRRRIGSGCGWNRRSGRSYCLCLGLPRAKLYKTPLYGSGANGTHKRKVRRLKIDNGKMAKKSHDSIRKNELITSCCVPKDIYEGKNKV